MRRFLIGLGLLSALLLCSCAGRTEVSTPVESVSSQVESIEESTSESSSESAPARSISGVVVHMDKEDFSFSRSLVLGTEGDKKTFDKQIAALSEQAASIVVGTRFEGDTYSLSAEQTSDLLAFLQDAPYAVFETAQNPSTGGTLFHLMVKDSAGTCLLHVSFDGDWLVLESENGNGPRVFDGSQSGLEGLTAFLDAEE